MPSTVASTVTPWFATSQLNSSEARRALSAAFGQSSGIPGTAEGGVLPGGGTFNSAFVPTSNGSATDPSVSVAPGQIVINRPVGGTYICTWPAAATVTLPLPLPGAGQIRYDILVAEVVDPEADSGATTGTVFQLRVVNGTAAASPTVPSVPSGAEVLYQWQVNNSGAISAITSRRRFTRSPGGVRLVMAGDTTPGSHYGDLRIFQTGQIDAYLNGTWVSIISPVAWTQVNTNLNFAGANGNPAGVVNMGSGGTAICRYKLVGKDLHLKYYFAKGTGAGFGTGDITTTLPLGLVSVARDQWLECSLWVNDVLVFDWPGGKALINASQNIVRPYFPIDSNDMRMFPYRIASDVGVVNQSIPRVPGGMAHPGVMTIYGLVEVA